MSDVEGRLSSAFGLLHSSPGAESAQSCVAAALLSWLEVSCMRAVLPHAANLVLRTLTHH